MKRHALSDAQWSRIQEFFPENGNRGEQWKDHRLMVDGIMWILKTVQNFTRPGPPDFKC
jgi:transposase